jgi:hypothetical protein
MKDARMPILAGVLTLAIAAALRFDLSEWLRGGFGWRWRYEPLDLARTLPLMIAVCFYLIGAWLLARRAYAARYAVSWSALGTLIIALAAVAVREGDVLYGLFARTASRLSTGPHWVAAHIDWSSGAWRDWSEQLAAFGGHLSNLPPGSALWYALLNSAFDQLPQVAAAVQRALMPFQCHNYDLIAYTSDIRLVRHGDADLGSAHADTALRNRSARRRSKGARSSVMVSADSCPERLCCDVEYALPFNSGAGVSRFADRLSARATARGLVCFERLHHRLRLVH